MNERNRTLVIYIIACGADLSYLEDAIMNAEQYHDEKEDISHDMGCEIIDAKNLVSSDDKQKKYVGYGYVNDEYCEYQILCPKCRSDKIAQNGSKNGDVKFRCKNKDCGKKYFYLKPTINKYINEEVKFAAVWLAKNRYPQNYIATICGVQPTTITKWVKEYDTLKRKRQYKDIHIPYSKDYELLIQLEELLEDDLAEY